MGFSYKPLFKIMVDRNMKRTDLHTAAGLSSATLAKLGKGEPLSGESIEKLCVYFHCQPGELVEYDWTSNEGKVDLPIPKKRTNRRNSAPHTRTKRQA